MEDSGRPIAAGTSAVRPVEGSVEADGVRIRYLDAGQGPPIVYLPGSDGLRLGRAHDLLAERFRVIALETPGAGESEADQRSMRDLARRLAAAAAALHLDRYSLIGASLGATLALWLALQHPDRVEALVLDSPTAIRPGGDATARDREDVAGLDVVAAVRGDSHRDAELEGRLSGLSVPTLVLFGTLDRIVPPETGRAYRAMLPNCHLVFVYDAGHAAALDRPEAFAGLVSDFLERREQFVVSRASGLAHP